VSRIILLDTGPLSILAMPQRRPPVFACRRWLDGLLTSGVLVHVPEVADYELRRELLRAGKANGLRRLDRLQQEVGYIPLTTETMVQAAVFWAALRQQGQPTAPDDALDGDVILAAQASILLLAGHSVTIATTNPGHLTRLVPAARWDTITG
jgi:predicted nucleic acid-binding protein